IIMHLRLILLIAFLASLTIAERARNDRRSPINDDDDDDNIDAEQEFSEREEDNEDVKEDEDEQGVVDAFKRFLLHKKTTTVKPVTSGVLSRSFSTSTARYRPFSTTTRYGYRTSRRTSQDKCAAGNPCKNGGSCRSLSSGSYYCFCDNNHYGKHCENTFSSNSYSSSSSDKSRKDHCLSSPCKNNGECVGLRTTYYCRCKTPFYGINCDKRGYLTN
ncbi:unnamed protein product, partial [Didymodactylos carnosus]